MTTDRRDFGHVYQRKGSPFWWVRYRKVIGHDEQGEPTIREYRESAKSADRKVAERILKRRRAEFELGVFREPATQRTKFSDLESLILNDYDRRGRRSADRLKVSLNHLREFFGGVEVKRITYDAVERYKTKRLEAGAAKSTVQNELSALSRAFRLARRAGLVTDVPVIDRMGKLDNVRTGFFEEADFRALLERLAAQYHAPLTFGYLTGWRVKSEVLPLTWAQVDFRAKTVRLEPGTTKNREGRTFPFATFPQLDALLTEQRRRVREMEKRSGKVIRWVFPSPERGQKLLYPKLSVAWRKVRKAAGCPHRIVHDFRRTAVRNFVRAGVPERVAMALTGHKTRSIFDRYNIVDERDLAEGVGRLARFVESRAQDPDVVSFREGHTEGHTEAVGGVSR